MASKHQSAVRDDSAFRRGFTGAIPFCLVIAPFGLLFGVVATEAGLDFVECMAMTILVLAGASQFAAVQLMSDQAPVFVVIATALAVNLRLAMYSASLTPHLGQASLRSRMAVSYLLVDQTYALAIQDYDRKPEQPLARKLSYFFGASACIVPVWYLSSMLGAVSGGHIPEALALDFAVPITFLAMVAPMLRSVPHLVAALVSIVAALAFAWMPHGSGLFVASVLAMMAGARTETWRARRIALHGNGG